MPLAFVHVGNGASFGPPRRAKQARTQAAQTVIAMSGPIDDASYRE
jgi:hypothetical protein